MKIQTAEQFDRLFKALALELMYANVRYDIFLKLNDSFREYKNEVNQSTTFWGITRDAIRDVATLGLCRVYDPDHRTNSLPNLLKEIRDNPKFHQIAMKNREVSGSSSSIDALLLEDDIRFVSDANPAVKRLIRWRSDFFVHKNAKRLADNKALQPEHVPKYGDLEVLLKKGLSIVNGYAGKLRSAEYGTFFPSGEDYKFVLESVRETLKNRRKEYAAELRSHGMDPKQFGIDD